LMPGYHATGRETSAYLVRNYVHQISGGVSKWFNYGILTTHRFDRGDATGFFEYDGSPKPMAIAHAVLSWLLESATFKKLTKPLSDIVCHEFAGKGEHINVCWATAWGEMRTRTVKTSTFGHPDKVYARDIMGRKIAVGQTLQVGEEPIYVISADR
ncbi:MAG: hypothetical protein KJP23_03795, partial [Deltaproteobacteria bacterium]|nr:hypothetical protein [Deltaproteobacteria bacterium]